MKKAVWITAAAVTSLFLATSQSASAAEREDYMCYSVKGTFTAVGGILLDDAFEQRTFDILKATDLCLPASVNGSVVLDSTTQLSGYSIKPSSVPQAKPGTYYTGVMTSVDDLGLKTGKPDRVLIPSNKCMPPGPCGSLTAPVTGTHDVDSYECRSTKLVRLCAENSPTVETRGDVCKSEGDCGGTDGVTSYCLYPAKFPKGLTRNIADDFTSPAKSVDLKKPSHICSAVDTDGDGRLHSNAQYYCYQVKPSTGSPKHTAIENITVADQYSSSRTLNTKKEDELCLAACPPVSPYVTKVNSLQIGTDGNPGNGLDIDNNPGTCAPAGSCSAGIDNEFAQVAGLANSTVADAVTSGSILLLVELDGLNLSGGETTLNVRTASLDPANPTCDFQNASCNYLISNTCDVSGSIVATLTGSTLSGGGPGTDLTIGIPLPGYTIPLTVHNLRVQGTLATSGGVVTGVTGVLGGAFVKQELLDIILALPDGTILDSPSADIAALIDGLLPVDVDLLGEDSIPESTSLGLPFTAIAGNVTGIQ